MEHKKNRRIWYLALAGLVALILVSGLVALQPYGTPLNFFIRGAASLGYLAVFAAIISSAYMPQLVRFFGRPFIKVHHILSVTGLVLIALHPVGVAIDSRDPRVFLPRFDSWTIFLTLGGRPAWYLIGVAALAAALRKRIGQKWRAVHLLNYLAFWLATAHAILSGTNFQYAAMRVVAILMALAVVAIFVQKRLPKRKR